MNSNRNRSIDHFQSTIVVFRHKDVFKMDLIVNKQTIEDDFTLLNKKW